MNKVITLAASFLALILVTPPLMPRAVMRWRESL